MSRVYVSKSLFCKINVANSGYTISEVMGLIRWQRIGCLFAARNEPRTRNRLQHVAAHDVARIRYNPLQMTAEEKTAARADIEATGDLLERALKLAGLLATLFQERGFPLVVVGGSRPRRRR